MPRGRERIYTDTERKEKQKLNYQKNKSKNKEQEARLNEIRYQSKAVILSKRERKEFAAMIREKNRERFDYIFGNEELWRNINSTSSEYLNKVERQKRKRRNGDYVNDKEVQRAVDVIYGGMKGDIIEEPKEEEYQSPYENETNE